MDIPLHSDCRLCAREKTFDPTSKAINKPKKPNKKQRRYLQALLSGYKWDTLELTYGFYRGEGTYYREWSEEQRASVVSGIESWEKVCGLTFTATDYDSALLKFHLVESVSYPYLGHAFFPVGKNKGKIFISHNNALDKTFRVGGYDYITVIHEIGHALGLSHTHDGVTFPGVRHATHGGRNNQNIVLNTVMGYNDLNGPLTPKTRASYGFVAGPMAYDVYAIQHLYGKPAGESVDTIYRMENNYFENIVDTGGQDTIVSESNQNTVIDLRAATVDGRRATGGGAVSRQQNTNGGFTISYGTVIENAETGDGNDLLRGNHASNVLKGNGGNDTFVATSGIDHLYGGSGKDRVVFQLPRRLYRIQKITRGVYKIIHKRRPQKDITFLYSIEWVRFRRMRRWIRLV